jgi:hypothetical protein
MPGAGPLRRRTETPVSSRNQDSSLVLQRALADQTRLPMSTDSAPAQDLAVDNRC